jgi:hypothetical protein
MVKGKVRPLALAVCGEPNPKQNWQNRFFQLGAAVNYHWVAGSAIKILQMDYGVLDSVNPPCERNYFKHSKLYSMEKATVQSLMYPGKGLSFKNSIILSLTLALTIVSHGSYAQGKLMNKLLAKAAAKVGANNAVMTATLDDVSPTVGVGSNLYPVELGTISQAFFKDWATGGQQVFLMFTKKSTPGFYKIDGSVKINGMEIEYLTSGLYSIIGGTSNGSRKIDITTSSGQKSSFTITPSKNQVKIISINGQEKDNVDIDLTKDVVLELEGTLDPSQMIKVSLAINQVSIKSIYDVCLIRAGSKLTIPAAAFRNINIVPAGDALYNYKKSYLMVTMENIENATDVTGSFSSVQYTSSYSDGKFVTVTTEPDLNKGLTAKGKESFSAGEVEYDFFKPNAFMSRPSTQAKKIGLVSFGFKGKTISEESVIVQEKDVNKGEAQITKTTKLVFPQQTDDTWNGVLEKLYPQLSAIVQEELGATVLPVETITKTEGYKSVAAFSDAIANTKEGFSTSYKSTKSLTIPPFNEGFGVNASNERIMKDTGADALMSFTLDLQLGKEGDFGIMTPKLTFELVGKINGLTTNTKYFTGNTIGKGIPSEDIGFEISFLGEGSGNFGKQKIKTKQEVGEITPDELDKILRTSDLLATFRKALKEIIAKEKANGDYETVWGLQR